jgi:hypothetical protein
MSTAKNAAKNAAEVIAALLAHAGLDLPVRLRAWAGGALAFEQGRMGVDQILAVKPHGPRR